MSRIGKKIIIKPESVQIKKIGINLEIVGPKGTLTVNGHPKIYYDIDDNKISVIAKSKDKLSRSLHGLYRSLVNNAIIGVTEGFKKKLEMKGVGYRATVNNNILELNVGFSHPVTVEAPHGIEITVEKNTNIHILGIDKQLVGEYAAKIRKVRLPEPYKGKGIKYSDEIIKRKAGKTAKTGA